MEKLHPGAKWLFRVKGYITPLYLAFIILIIFINFSQNISSPQKIFMMIIGFLFIVIVIAEIYAQMAYNRWFYEFASDGLKLERGIIWKGYSNVPYSRVQNVDITRGIIARMIGFSTVNIQTAGYGVQNVRSEGYIPAVSVEKAEEIRKFLMKKINKRKDSGM